MGTHIDENAPKHETPIVSVSGFHFKLSSRDTCSAIDLGEQIRVLVSTTFFIDLCSEVETVLGVRVRSISLVPSNFKRFDFPKCVILFHDSIREAEAEKKLQKMQAQAIALRILSPLC